MTQRVSLVRSISTGREDVAKIQYTLRNDGSGVHQAGLELTFDTQINANDGAPISTSNGYIAGNQQYTAANMPTFWQAFEVGPTQGADKLVAQGTLVGSGAVAPDRLVVRGFSSFGNDSFVDMDWNEQSLAPGASREIVTFYGLGGGAVSPGTLSLNVAATLELAAVPGGLSPNPFEVNALVTNTGSSSLEGVAATIELPTGLTLAAGETASQALNPATLAAGQTGQVSWKVQAALGTAAVRTYAVRVSSSTAGVSPNSLNRTVAVPAAISVPGAPTGVTATAGKAQATVAFTAPASDGGSAITGYTVTSSPGGFTATGTASPLTVTGLSNGTAYTFTVTATNAVGTGAASAASNSVTPSGTRTILVSIPQTTVEVSKTLTVPVNIASPAGVDIFAVHLEIDYNPKVLKATGVSLTGTVASGWALSSNLDQAGTMVLSLASSRRLSQAGVLVNLQFTAVGGEGNTTPVHLDSLVLNEGDPEGLAVDGKVTVVAPPPLTTSPPPPPAPQAGFNVSPTSGVAPLTVVLSNTSTNATAYTWTLPGGSSTSETPGAQTLSQPGTYNFSLVASNSAGQSSASATVTVFARAQAAFAANKTKVPPGGSVGFADASTGAISSRAWNFGDGQTSGETNPTHVYATAGTYTVSLTVSGSGGTSTEVKAGLIEVGNKVPVIEPAIAVSPALEGDNLTVTLSGNEKDDFDTGAALKWTAAVVSGGGLLASFNNDGGANDQFVFTPRPDASGQVRVKFTLTDSQGASVSQEVLLSWTAVADAPVVADPSPADRGVDVRLSALLKWVATDADSGDVLTFEVRLGKTNPPTTVAAAGLKQAALLTTGLDQSSTYFWQVLAKDSFGLTTTGPVWRFTTVADREAPVITKGPVGVGVTTVEATVQWDTDEPGTSIVEYSVNENLSNALRASDAALTTEHSVTLTGLTVGTTYHFRVSSADGANNLSKTKTGKFKTLAVKDELPPKILKGPAAVGATTEEATVQWTTDEVSTSVVEYSTAENLSGAQQLSDEALTTDHSVALTGLTVGTTYYFRVRSQDASGNTSEPKTGKFKTLKVADVLPPKILKGPAALGITVDGATVQWTTDEASTSVVEYGLTGSLGQVVQDPGLVTSHSLVLTGLTGANTYFYRVLSTDASENQGSSSQGSFKTLATADVLPPVLLTGPNVTGITQNSATVRWTTDEISTSNLEVGLKADLSDAQAAGSADLVLAHAFTLTNLEAKTTYYYRVSSVDGSGNPSAVKTGNFKTLATEDKTPPKIISGPVLTASDISAQLGWTTNEDADALVEYGIETLDQSVVSTEPQRKQSITLTNLLPGTKYIYRITYADASGNASVSPQSSFTTAKVPDTKPPVITGGPATTVRLDDQAVIEWTTDEESDSEVAFGLTAEYGSTAGSTEPATKHTVRLVNLEPGTTYHYQVRSTDLSKNGPTKSGDRTLTTRTAPDKLPPKIMGVPSVLERSDVSATISWTTDELADGFVEYSGEDGEQLVAGSEEGSLAHVVKLSNLKPGTPYRCKVQSMDVAGNGPTVHPGTLTFTTRTAPDVLPPVFLSNPFVVNTTTTGATVRWGTDEPSDSHIYLGTQPGAYDQEVVLPEDVKAHTVGISGLQPGTQYYFQAGSVDGSDNGPALSREYSFKTRLVADILPPVLLSGPSVRSVSSVSALIEWVTSEPASTVLDYGPSLGYESGHMEQGELVELHQVFLTNLQAGTLYHYKVSSTDGAGNTVSSDPQGRQRQSRDHTFRTALVADQVPPTFLEGPVVYRSDEGAVIQWRTDEPAGFEVIFDSDPGLGSATREVVQSNDLNQRQAARLSRLRRGTRYFYQVTVWDQDGNKRVATNAGGGRAAKLAQAAGASFVTLLEPDVQTPVLLQLPKVASANATALTIEWDTDELSDSVVEFGPETGALDQAVGSPLAVTHHQMTLTNLVPGQAYRYRVNSTDISGNGPAQGPVLVAKTRTEVDLTPPLIENTPRLAGVTDTWATIGWSTDEGSTSVVDFGVAELENRREDPDLTRQHLLTVTGLKPATTYRFKVSSTDGSQNGPTTSGELTFTTAALPDLVPPRIIGEPRVLNRTNLLANLAWETDELADSFVKYGLRADALDKAAGSATTETQHRISLTNLKPATTYFYTVSSVDRNSNGPVESAVQQFTTAEFQDLTPPAPPAGMLTRSSSEAVFLSWTPGSDPDLAGYNVYRRQMVFPPAPFRLVASQVQDPKYLDTGLKNGLLYEYQLTAMDNAFPPNESAVSKGVQVLPLRSKAIPAPLVSAVKSNPLVTTLEIVNIATLSKGKMSYMFQVSTDSAFSELVASAGRVTPAAGAVTPWTFASALEKGRVYWWRARANDGFFDGTWMAATRFQVTGFAGDFSGDDLVSFDDFFLFADHFGRKAGAATWNPQYDLSGNGAIDYDDFFLFADHFGEGRGVSKVPVQLAAAAPGAPQAHLRVTDIDARSVSLTLDLGETAGVRGYGLVLRYPRGAEILNFDQVSKASQSEAPSTLGGVLRQTEERVYLASYHLIESSAPREGAAIQLQFSLPSGFAEGEIQLEELWTVDDHQQIRRVADVARVSLLPQAFSLAAPYPNPFNPAVQIPYALPERTPVKLQVYNILGQQVQTLVNQVQEAGFYQLSWQGQNDQGQAVASGIYFIRLEAGSLSKLQKVVLLK